MEVHADAVSGTRHHGGWYAHAVDVRIFIRYADGSFFPAKIVDADKFPILCLIVDPGDHRAYAVETHPLRQTQGVPALDCPVHMLLLDI